jgi:hypothetical protein
MHGRWRELGRAIKQAALGTGYIDLRDRYVVAYEARGVCTEVDYPPTPKTAGIICENVALNGLADRITAVSAFVHARPGTLVKFYGSQPCVYNSAVLVRRSHGAPTRPGDRFSWTLIISNMAIYEVY